MDRLAELREAYQQAAKVGEELLSATQGDVTPEMIDSVARLVEQREAITQRTVGLYRPGDQVALRSELQTLVQQQRALDAQMGRLMRLLQEGSKDLQETRSRVGRVRHVLNRQPPAKWVDELR